MSLKRKRLLLRVGFHSGVLTFLFILMLVGTSTESSGTAALFSLMLIGYLVTLRVNPLPRLLERKLFLDIECSACGQNIELVSSWTCGCGFITWEPRHALAPCSVCKKEFQWLQCPSCENGIQT